MKYKNYTTKQLINALKTSKSIRQVLIKLNLSTNGGGSYQNIKRLAYKYNIDISNYLGKGWLKNQKLPYKIWSKKPLEEWLIIHPEWKAINNTILKKRLIENKILNNICIICNLNPFWNNKKLIMVLDHINGNNKDYRKENLRLICPNCNSQTNTFCSKNKK